MVAYVLYCVHVHEHWRTCRQLHTLLHLAVSRASERLVCVGTGRGLWGHKALRCARRVCGRERLMLGSRAHAVHAKSKR